MHKFTGRADVFNFAAQIPLIWRRTVCTDWFIPSSSLLVDNKPLPAALLPVFFCDVVLCTYSAAGLVELQSVVGGVMKN